MSTSCRSPLNSSPSSASLALSESGSQIRSGWNRMESSEFSLEVIDRRGRGKLKGNGKGKGKEKTRPESSEITGVRLPYGSNKKVGDY
ncbi:hypothetical protein DVH24_030783 [Malus domestica]|uniref:Uncharacterized protein n=1 Tax=Malus domestica TaxID=3750 RepID=A0A498HCF3_MALDO|nr:hypothetical protein DVH24_030783 [Malus domestica]